MNQDNYSYRVSRYGSNLGGGNISTTFGISRPSSDYNDTTPSAGMGMGRGFVSSKSLASQAQKDFYHHPPNPSDNYSYGHANSPVSRGPPASFYDDRVMGIGRGAGREPQQDRFGYGSTSIGRGGGGFYGGGISSSGGSDPVLRNNLHDKRPEYVPQSQQSSLSMMDLNTFGGGMNQQPQYGSSQGYYNDHHTTRQKNFSNTDSSPSFFERRASETSGNNSNSGMVSRRTQRGGGGGRINNRNSSRFPNRSQASSGRPEPLLTTESKPEPQKVGVHLDISQGIFQLMPKKELGNKLFTMVPKFAQTVFDFKMHVSKLLEVDQTLINFFINGFRIPDSENVEAFACISSNALVQVVRPGYKPPCDLSKFKGPNTPLPNTTATSKRLKRKKSDPPQNQPQTLQPIISRKESTEESLLEPPTRRTRYSNTSTAQDSPNTSRTSASLSPSKAPVIEIVLSDDDDDEAEAQETKKDSQQAQGSEVSPSTSSSNLVIEEKSLGSNEIEHSPPVATNLTELGGNDQFAIEEEEEEFNEDENGAEVDDGRLPNPNCKLPIVAPTDHGDRNDIEQLSKNAEDWRQRDETLQNDGNSSSENWLNADGQIVSRTRKSSSKNKNTEVVDLGSPDNDNNDDDDNTSSVSTTCDDDSNEPFFTISELHSIPVGVLKNIDEGENAYQHQHNMKRQSSGGETTGNSSPSSLANPFAGVRNSSPRYGSNTRVNEIVDLVDISEGGEADQLGDDENVAARTSGSENEASVIDPTRNSDNIMDVMTAQTDEEEILIPGDNTNPNQIIIQNIDIASTALEIDISNLEKSEEELEPKTKAIDEINQVTCGSLILYQIMESATQNKENELNEENNCDRKLSDVKCCKVIGRSGVKLTLEPVDQDAIRNGSIAEADEASESVRKFIFVEFNDMFNLQELIKNS